MGLLSPGFLGRRREHDPRLPPGQYLTEGFPVLSAGPTPRIARESWELAIESETGQVRRWDWAAFQALPQEDVTVDIHCVTSWSKLGTTWRGVSVDVLLERVDSAADYVLVGSYGGYTTNLTRADLTGGKAWIVHEFDGEALAPEHGGPARLLVPARYFWKSAKWVHGLRLGRSEQPGFWESNGYHRHGDPWREERYW